MEGGKGGMSRGSESSSRSSGSGIGSSPSSKVASAYSSSLEEKGSSEEGIVGGCALRRSEGDMLDERRARVLAVMW